MENLGSVTYLNIQFSLQIFGLNVSIQLKNNFSHSLAIMQEV